MNVLILFSSSEIGGAERSLSRMAITGGSDVNYTLATLDGYGPWIDWCKEQGVDPLIFGLRSATGHGQFGIKALLRFLKQVRKKQYDVIYVIGLRASIWLRFVRFFYPKTKLVHGIRWNPNSDSRLDQVLRLVERLFGGLIDLYICNSQITGETLINDVNIPRDKVKVIYNGIELIPNIPNDYNERASNVVIVGNQNPRKGHIEFLDAISLVLKKQPYARFIFIGRDDMAGQLAREIKKRSLESAIILAGYQPKVDEWLSSARVMVLPSLWGEGCPTSILEAHAHALPVVASDIDGIPELVDDGVDGLLISHGNQDMYSKSILQLLLDQELAVCMGEAGRKKVLKRFTLKESSLQHSEVFRDIALLNAQL